MISWTAASQASLSMGFSRQEYWSGLPCPLPGDLPGPRIEPTSLMSPTRPPGKPFYLRGCPSSRCLLFPQINAKTQQIINYNFYKWFPTSPCRHACALGGKISQQQKVACASGSTQGSQRGCSSCGTEAFRQERICSWKWVCAGNKEGEENRACSFEEVNSVGEGEKEYELVIIRTQNLMLVAHLFFPKNYCIHFLICGIRINICWASIMFWATKITLEEGMATHSSVPAWRIPWTEEPGGLQSMGSQRVRHNWNNLAHTHALYSRGFPGGDPWTVAC